MLDLGLEHLGVEIPSESFRSNVHNVVKACGESEWRSGYVLLCVSLTQRPVVAALQRLADSDNHAPARKSSLLVEAHKQIVGVLTPINMFRIDH